MDPVAIITPLKALRMLLDGSGVLVRAERWKEINQAMTEIVHEKSITGSDYCGGCGQDWPCQHEGLRQEVEYWKGMYEQAHQQRSNWYERCQAAERQLAQTIGEYAELRSGMRRTIVGVDPALPETYRIVAACHCGRPLLFSGEADPWCQGCNMSASTSDCVSLPV